MTLKTRRSQWLRFGFAVLLCFSVWTIWSGTRPARAQDGKKSEQPEAKKADDNKAPDNQKADSKKSTGTEGNGNSNGQPATDKIVPAKKEEKTTLGAKIDKVFAKAVEYIGKVLFFPVTYQTQDYVQFEEQEVYYRAADSTANFQKLGGPGNLTPDQVTTQQALKKLSDLQKGAYQGQAVEYVTKKLRSDKFVLQDDGKYYRVGPLRGVLETDTPLTVQDMEKAAAQGILHVAPDATGPRPWQKTEKISQVPLVVVWLAGGAIFFTIYMGGYNFWGFRHALDIVRGRYDNPDEPGEVTHFQALASALSATVGLGNIAGVTIAMTTGGPGAFFWMLACGFFGMTSKFVECTLGQKYRKVKKDGTVLGGPMQYLRDGLAELNIPGFKQLGAVLAIMFAIMCMLASLGGGNMFQANQSGQQMLTMLQLGDYEKLDQIDNQIKTAAEKGDINELGKLKEQRKDLDDSMASFGTTFRWIYGVVLAGLVGVVIIGGIKRIGAAAEKVVPTMCIVYVLACLWIIFANFGKVPEMIGLIFSEAFSPRAFGGGLLGIIVIGVQRAAFSNEAGVGSASIAHSAAKTDEPIREGTVALMEPFIDTIVVCSMTALVILITGAYQNTEWLVDQKLEGAQVTLKAFQSQISWFPYVLTTAVVLFAYSTLISWSYYGERCWERLFGARSTMIYKGIFVLCVLLGPVVELGSVLDFSDIMILAMAFPNVLGLLLLSPKIRADLHDYWRRLRAGEFKVK